MEDSVEDSIDGSDFLELEDNLKCALCKRGYRCPKILKCRHSFCESCLAEYIPKQLGQTGSTADGFPCPVCQSFHYAPEEGVPVENWASRLEDNYVFIGMLDIINSAEPQNAESTPDTAIVQWPKKPEVTKQASVDDVDEAVPLCDQHNKVLDFFCKFHNMNMCMDCVILKHRTCDVSKSEDVLVSQLRKIEDLDKNAEANNEVANVLSAEIRVRRDNLVRDRDRVKEEIQSMKREIINNLNQAEREINEEIDRVCDDRLRLYDERIKCCSTIKQNTEQIRPILNKLPSMASPNFVVNTVIQRERSSEAEVALMQEMMSTTLDCKLNLTKDLALVTALASCKHFGHVTVSNSVMEPLSVARNMWQWQVRRGLSEDSAPPKKLRLQRTINALLPKEKRNNWLTGVCFMKDDRIVLIDRNNRRVKLYSPFCENLCSLKLRKCTLFAATATGDDEIAVTIPLTSMIQYLSTTNNVLEKNRTIETKQPCYGICHGLKQLFVCCAKQNNVPCCIKVFDDGGNFVRDVIFDNQGSLIFTSLDSAYISINPIDSQLSVVDQRSDRHTIVTFDLNGEVKSRDPMPNWTDKVRGIAYLDSFLFLALENRTLCTLSDIGSGQSKFAEIETSIDLNYPCAVAVNNSKDKIIVSRVHPMFNFRENNIVRILSSESLPEG